MKLDLRFVDSYQKIYFNVSKFLSSTKDRINQCATFPLLGSTNCRNHRIGNSSSPKNFISQFVEFFLEQPLQNRAVLEHVGAEKKQQWAQHYISKGLHGDFKKQNTVSLFNIDRNCFHFNIFSRWKSFRTICWNLLCWWSNIDCRLLCRSTTLSCSSVNFPLSFRETKTWPFVVFSWKIDLKQYPILKAVDERLSQIEGFQMAHPRQQIDCPPNEKQILWARKYFWYWSFVDFF